ncbi:hypothetical protein GCM10010294_45900 [Streptomyces griseoloalbus]|uniref:hypothetical protein n=1 Tax=Streptomyces griseoloalbus TaxID=67303 RepID=UPI001874F6C8|nr:hypothetical protein GCM10010294_45900 [Streptomyces griseoloalbus]
MKRAAMLAASAFSALSLAALAALTACGTGAESDGTTGEPRSSRPRRRGSRQW